MTKIKTLEKILRNRNNDLATLVSRMASMVNCRNDLNDAYNSAKAAIRVSANTAEEYELALRFWCDEVGY